jgi:CRISPR-associated protein Cmr1
MKSLPAPPTQAAQDAFLRASQQTPNSTTLRYTVRLITPMLGGGVEAGKPDRRMYFRASEIKGQLRWWWRTLARAGDLAGGVPADQQLAKREQILWGGVAGVRPTKSTVRLAIEDIASDTTVAVYDAYRDGCIGMGYALFPAQATRANGNTPGQPAKDIVCAGAAFSLVIRLANSDDKADVLQVIEAWATFGGIGSRSRRGIGAVEVRDSNQVLLSSLRPDGTSSIKALQVAISAAAEGLACFPNAQLAAGRAVGALRHFRQGLDFGRNKGAEGSRTPGRSRWPEPDVLRQLTEHHFDGEKGPSEPPVKKCHRPQWEGDPVFPRAAFGLPIVIRFQDAGPARPARLGKKPLEIVDFDPDTRTINLPGKERMASPLILRPVAVMVEKQVVYFAVAAVIRRDLQRHQNMRVSISPSAGLQDDMPTWNASWRPGSKGGADGCRPLEDKLCASSTAAVPTSAVESFMCFFPRFTG